MQPYNHKEIEPKWQNIWAEENLYSTPDSVPGKKNFYSLVEFAYPSGNLHVGHWYAFAVPDMYARMKRMQGNNVLFPFGFDSFGLPAENAAIKHDLDPREWTYNNIDKMRTQLKTMGAMFDWNREVRTSDPEYYRWTQWLFLQMFKAGKIGKKKSIVNWDPVDQTVLANEQVLSDGTAERSGAIVEKRELEEWAFKITDYADRLINDLETVDYPEPIKQAQREWIGRSEGAEITFVLNEEEMNDINTGPEADAFRPGHEPVERHNVVVIIEHPTNDEFLCARWKQVEWQGFVTGGIEPGKTIEETVLDEVREETGYQHPKIVKVYDRSSHGMFWHVVKEQNRHAHYRIVHVKLDDLERIEPSSEEQAIAEFVWVPRAEVDAFVKREDMRYPWRVVTGRDVLGSMTVFTTRPDTLFGVTYVVLAPEHPLVQELLSHAKNRSDVEDYIAKVKNKSELERQQTKEKTGVQVQGIMANNPATGEQVPVWIANYVLASYGTGAVMAVPAHDERDFEFAKKYHLPIKKVIARETGIKRENEEFRNGGAAVVFDPVAQKYAVGEWPNGKPLLLAGGVDEGETVRDGVLREVREESGLYDFKYIEHIETSYAHYFNTAKKVNRVARAECFAVVLSSTATEAAALEHHEECVLGWRSAQEIRDWWQAHNAEGDYEHYIRFLNESVARLIELGYDTTSDPKKFTSTPVTEPGVLDESGEFTGITSEQAKKQITEFVGGEWKTTYKIRDWGISRQRYWGCPIPIVYDPQGKAHPIPDEHLPWILPTDVDFKPNGTAPLARSQELRERTEKIFGAGWTPEVDTMDTFVDSSWYFLRYLAADNADEFAPLDIQKQWMPVNFYSGGAEHTTMHLLYSRFFYKALYDLGLVPTNEPYQKRMNRSMILAEDGRKMSKRWGNTVNPDEEVERVGADSVRTYLAFIGPYNEVSNYRWSLDALVGVRKFIERVGRYAEMINLYDKTETDSEVLRNLHKTIKFVSEDLEKLKTNTAVAHMMKFLNSSFKPIDEKKEEKVGNEISSITKEDFGIFLKLLAPFAPHMTEEIWRNVFGYASSIHLESWPSYDESLIQDNVVTIGVQINGKVRAEINVGIDESEDSVRAKVLALPEIQKWLDGQEPRKFIYKQGTFISIVI